VEVADPGGAPRGQQTDCLRLLVLAFAGPQSTAEHT